jgi:hypothetical protein
MTGNWPSREDSVTSRIAGQKWFKTITMGAARLDTFHPPVEICPLDLVRLLAKQSPQIGTVLESS